MPRPAFASVDAYLEAQPEKVRAILERVRAILRKALPQAEESISYQIPAYKLAGKPVVYFAGFAGHYSIFPVNDRAVAAIPQLGAYRVSKGTARFSLTEPVPDKLITAFAKFREEETLTLTTGKAASQKAQTKRPVAKKAALAKVLAKKAASKKAPSSKRAATSNKKR